MKTLRRTFSAGLLIFAGCFPSGLQEVQFIPYASVSALGGRYLTGDTHSTGINADYDFVPAIQVNPTLLVIPIYIGSYHETQSV